MRISSSTVYRLILACFLIGLAFFGYFYVAGSQPCAKPVTYRIGEFNTGFGISQDSFLSSIQEAESVWEKAVGKDLFKYDAKGKITVNLIYDERQKETQEQLDLESQIAKAQSQYQAKKVALDKHTDAYEGALREYQALLEEYNDRAAGYESTVRYWNRRGGAPAGEYQKITEEQKALQSLQKALDAKRLLLNSLASEVNALVAEVNVLAQQTNTTVDRYNSNDLVGTEFDQGLYVSNKSGVSVNIYQFTDHVSLVRVLTHEFGHVLGLDHNDNPESIMYELNQGENETLSPEDLFSLKETCRIE